MTTRDEQNDRYVDFRCCDCGERRYSAGRPRCVECHREYVAPIEPGIQRLQEAQRGA